MPKGDIIAGVQRLVVRHGKRERLRQFVHCAQQAIHTVFLCQDVLLRRRE
jgi:hypothetical protein